MSSIVSLISFDLLFRIIRMKSIVSYYQFIDSFSFIFTSLVQDKYFCLRNDFADSFEFFPLYIKLASVCPWCGVGLLRLLFLCCGVISKLTLLLVLAAPVKRKGARGEVRFPGDPATMCPVLFKGSRSLLLLACCYVPIGGRMLIYKGGT